MADLVTLKEMKAYLGPMAKESPAFLDEMLPQFITAASDHVRTYCGQNFDQRQYTEVRNGTGRERLLLRQRPVSASPLPVVTEDGLSVSVVTGYSESAGAVLDVSEGALYRRSGSTVTRNNPSGLWSIGIGNITVAYTGGYAVASIPSDLKLVVEYIAASSFKTIDRKEIGVQRRSTGQGSVDWLQDLPAFYKRILDSYRRSWIAD